MVVLCCMVSNWLAILDSHSQLFICRVQGTMLVILSSSDRNHLKKYSVALVLFSVIALQTVDKTSISSHQRGTCYNSKSRWCFFILLKKSYKTLTRRFECAQQIRSSAASYWRRSIHVIQVWSEAIAEVVAAPRLHQPHQQVGHHQQHVERQGELQHPACESGMKSTENHEMLSTKRKNRFFAYFSQGHACQQEQKVSFCLSFCIKCKKGCSSATMMMKK